MRKLVDALIEEGVPESAAVLLAQEDIGTRYRSAAKAYIHLTANWRLSDKDARALAVKPAVQDHTYQAAVVFQYLGFHPELAALAAGDSRFWDNSSNIADTAEFLTQARFGGETLPIELLAELILLPAVQDNVRGFAFSLQEHYELVPDIIDFAKDPEYWRDPRRLMLELSDQPIP